MDPRTGRFVGVNECKLKIPLDFISEVSTINDETQLTTGRCTDFQPSSLAEVNKSLELMYQTGCGYSALHLRKEDDRNENMNYKSINAFLDALTHKKQKRELEA